MKLSDHHLLVRACGNLVKATKKALIGLSGFAFRGQRRTVLRLSLSTVILYSVSGILGLSARAEGARRTWRINASSYATGIERFFKLVKDSALPDGSFPVSALMWYFPLNPIQADGFQRIVDRGLVNFDATKATAQAKYDSLDFKDDAIGNVSVILHETLTAEYKVDATSVAFVFQEPLPQVVIWKIPAELRIPKSLRVASIEFAIAATKIVLTNTVNTDLLEIQLYVDPPGGANITMASANPLSAADAFLLLAANTTICCQKNCRRDDGTIGSETEVSKRWSIIKRIVPPNSGECSLWLVEKDTPPLGIEYKVIAGGFYTMEAASDAMDTKYKKECTPP